MLISFKLGTDLFSVLFFIFEHEKIKEEKTKIKANLRIKKGVVFEKTKGIVQINFRNDTFDFSLGFENIQFCN